MGASNKSVVHMLDQRSVKKGLFFEAKLKQQLGVKMCPFLRKKVLLDSTKECLGVIFQTLPNISSKKSLLGINLGQNRAKFLLSGCFSREEKLRYGYVLKPLVTHVYNTNI